MGFWDVAGTIGKGALGIAVDMAKALPSALSEKLSNQPGQTSEQMERNERLAAWGESIKENDREKERAAKEKERAEKAERVAKLGS
jgi:hypothetical protein